MAITAKNIAYTTGGPTASGQILAPNELSNLEGVYQGIVTFTLDGSTTSATVNFIDGTKTLSFTPSAMLAQVVGGTQNAASPVGITSTSVTDNTKGVVTISGAGTNANTIKVFVSLVK